MIRSLGGPRAWFALALLAATPAVAAAQNAVISGRVTSEQGQPLQGANVYITELSLSVGTNQTGNYTITVPAARVSNQSVMLRVRSVGFAPQSRQVTVRAGAQTGIDFTMRPDVTRLSEVVVTGVSAETEAIKVPFSVARVDTSQMPVVGGNAVAQLQGKIAGANIVSASGRPGAAPAVVLRGPTSINANGRGQGPLYIVDGVLLNGSTPDLNPNDIENIEVVKGAAAASLYGARAGGGVINITTKSGRSAQEGVKFGVRTEYGQNDIERDFSLAQQTAATMDPSGSFFCAATTSGSSPCARYIDLNTERLRVNNVQSPVALTPQSFYNDAGIANNLGAYRLRHVFQANSFRETYNQIEQATKLDNFVMVNADMRGKVSNTGFFASAGYTDQAGAFEYLEGFQRYSGRLNLDQSFGDRLTFQANTFYSVQEEDNGGSAGDAFFRLTRSPAYVNLNARDEYGRLYIRSNVFSQGSQNQSPLYLQQYSRNNSRGTRFLGSANTRFEATDWLDLTADFAYDRGTSTAITFEDFGFRNNTNANRINGFFGTSGGDGRSMNTSVGAIARPRLFENLVTTLSAKFLYDAQQGYSLSAQGTNLAAPGLNTADAAIQNRSIGSTTSEVNSMSYFGGLDLDYLDRYILNFSVRREGSSLFGSANRWATFPRVAGAWIASQEPWWPAAEAVSLMKFRAAYGQAGQRPSRTAQYETFSISSSGALSPGTLGNVNLRPEILTEVEVGIDAELFSRYGLNLTYAQSKSDDQILLAPPPAASGFANQWQNVGELTNKTWEASLDIPLINRADLRWSTRLIYDRNRAVISRLDIPEYQTGDVQGGETMYWVRQGERLGTIYGRKFVSNCSELPGDFAAQCGGAGSQFQRNADGLIVWTGGRGLDQGITDNLWSSTLPVGPWGTPNLSWGMPIVVHNDDETLSIAQVPLGNGTPDFHAAVSTNFSWKKFSAYGLFDGSFGRRVFNHGYQWSLGDFMTGTIDQGNKSVGDAKPLGYYYRASAYNTGSGIGGLYDVLGPNNHSVEDASFVKLREVTLNYNVGSIAGSGNWTVGLVGRNLITFTDYRGFDPEVGIGGGQLNNAALNAVDSFGFPNVRSFTLQLQTSF